MCYPTGPCPRPAEERCDRWSAADTRETSLAGGECPSSPTPQPNQPTQNPDSSPRQPRLRPSGSPQAAGSQARRLTAATLWIQTVVKRCHWMDGPTARGLIVWCANLASPGRTGVCHLAAVARTCGCGPAARWELRRADGRVRYVCAWVGPSGGDMFLPQCVRRPVCVAEWRGVRRARAGACGPRLRRARVAVTLFVRRQL